MWDMMQDADVREMQDVRRVKGDVSQVICDMREGREMNVDGDTCTINCNI